MQRIRIKSKTDEKTWSEKEYRHTIDLATKAVEALFNLNAELNPKTDELEVLTDSAIDDIVRVIWVLNECKKEYWPFKRKILEAIEAKMKEEPGP